VGFEGWRSYQCAGVEPQALNEWWRHSEPTAGSVGALVAFETQPDRVRTKLVLVCRCPSLLFATPWIRGDVLLDTPRKSHSRSDVLLPTEGFAGVELRICGPAFSQFHHAIPRCCLTLGKALNGCSRRGCAQCGKHVCAAGEHHRECSDDSARVWHKGGEPCWTGTIFNTYWPSVATGA
jgi:hypothetical protein